MMLGKIEDRERRGHQRIRWLDGIIDLMDMALSKFQELGTKAKYICFTTRQVHKFIVMESIIKNLFSLKPSLNNFNTHAVAFPRWL